MNRRRIRNLGLAAALAATAWSGARAEEPAASAAAPTGGVRRAHAFALHGAPKYGADFKHFDYVNPDAPKGGTLRYSSYGSFDALNPFIIRGTSPGDMAELLYDSLVTSPEDEPFTVYGLLAESIEIPDDRSWVGFHLRPEARWNDGKPVTADDVVWTFNTLMTTGAPSYRYYYKAITKAERVGEREVRFHFEPGSQSRELPLIAGQFPILPRHYWATRDFSATTLEPPLGSGPYRIASLEANRFIVYERVTNYWARDLPVRRGAYNFDRVRVEYFLDDTVRLEAFKAGTFDWIMEGSAKNWATAYVGPAFRQNLIRRENLPNHRPAPAQTFVFNTRRPVFQDARVRYAVSHAFDFQWANRMLFYGAYTRTRSYFENTELAAVHPPTPGERALLEELARKHPGAVPPEALTTVYVPPDSGDWKTMEEHRLAVRKNLIEAKRLLDEAGWRIRPSDRRLVHATLKDEDGKPLVFDFEILLVSPSFERVALPFAQALKRLGIQARVRTVDTAQFINRMNEYDYDMTIGYVANSLSPGNEQLGYWGSASADVSGGMNVAGVKNPAIDEAIQLVIDAPDRASLVERCRVLDRLLQWGHYGILHWFVSIDRIASWDRFQHPQEYPVDLGLGWARWWVDPEKDRALNAARGKAAPSAP